MLKILVEEELPNGSTLCWELSSHGQFWRNKYLASMGWCPHCKDKTPLETRRKYFKKFKVCPKCGAKFDKVGVEIFE